METSMDNTSYQISSPDSFVVTDSFDNERNDLMNKILGENVAVSIGNYIFIPPLDNPKVTSPEKTYELIKNPNFTENYIRTPIDIDGENVIFMTHISRIVHEGQPSSVSVYSVDKFNENDLRIAFKKRIPTNLGPSHCSLHGL